MMVAFCSTACTTRKGRKLRKDTMRTAAKRGKKKKLRMYLLRQDREVSRGNGGGVPISVLLDEVRKGAGGDSRGPFACTPTRVIELLTEGSDKPTFQGVYRSGPVARATGGAVPVCH